jgi:hypothetical protein
MNDCAHCFSVFAVTGSAFADQLLLLPLALHGLRPVTGLCVYFLSVEP